MGGRELEAEAEGLPQWWPRHSRLGLYRDEKLAKFIFIYVVLNACWTSRMLLARPVSDWMSFYKIEFLF